MCDLAKQKKVLAYDDATVSTADSQTLVPGFVGAGTCPDGKVYGLPVGRQRQEPAVVRPAGLQGRRLHRADHPGRADRAHRQDPRSQGKTPWCIAAESGQATGWPITDWIEDLVLRLAGPENYDKWVTGELKFNSPEIKPAFEYFQKIAFTDGNVLGGTKAIVATNFQTGGNALFEAAPRLLPVQAGHLHRRQGRLPGRGARQPGHHGRRGRLPAEGGRQQPGPQRW